MTFKVGHSQKSGPEVTRNNAPGETRSSGQSSHSETRRDKTYAHDNTPTRQRELETRGQNLRERVERQSQKHDGESHSKHSESSQQSQYFQRSQRSQHSEHSEHSQHSDHSDHSLHPQDSKYSQRSQYSQRTQYTQQSQHSQHPEHSQHSQGSQHSPDSARSQYSQRSEYSQQSQRSEHSHHSDNGRSERSLDVRINGDKLGVEIEAKVGLNKSHGSVSSHHSHGDFDGHSESHESHGNVDSHHSQGDFDSRSENHGSHARVQYKADASFSSQRHVHGESHGHDEGERTGNHSHSEIHTGSHDNFEQRLSHHSNEGANNAKHLLRDTLRTVRDDLHTFRPDHDHGPAPRTIGLTDRHVERVLDLATRGLENRFNHGEHPERIVREVTAEASRIIRLAEHFSRLEPIGGEPVRRAYEAVINFLLNVSEAESTRFGLTAELLRDLRTGAFLNPRDMEGPYPLVGRARIVSEMMAVMRTIDAIEKFAAAMKTSANSGPTFPGLAGRLEIPRLIATLGGELTDATGRPLIMADGTPLKLGELLWLNASSDSVLDLWAIDRLANRLSPVVVHGFDAVYSLIGFDGRHLSLPRFMAIQSQINSSEFEWLFGHAPLSEGWVRLAIEFLKDSISFDNNVLGELLEEAITTGRFHLTVMSGTVEDGKAVSGSFSFTPVNNFIPALS